MDNIVTKIQKAFIGILIFASSILCVFVTPDLEETDTIFSSNSYYNFVPRVIDENEISTIDTYSLDNINVIDTFVGTVTAYGPDCIGCSGVTASGYKVANNSNGVITSTTLTYNDDTFGELRVLAAANNIPFGTVIRISGGRIEGSILGIVLDRGGAMNNAWASGEVLIDVLFSSEKSSEVYEFGRQKNVTFEVLRYGR